MCPVTPPRSVVELGEGEKTVNIRNIDKLCSILNLSSSNILSLWLI